MVTVTRFAEAVLPHGTTTAFIDNHEMANVFGLEGMRWMLEEGRGLPLKVYLAVPSCVPALPGFEDAGASLGPDEIREALGWEGVAGLGEMMNMPGVIEGDESIHAEIAATLEAGKPVTGHWSLAGVRDHRLQAYIAAGVDSCHETTSREDALAKLRAGMWVQFREGSTFRDVAALAAVLTEDGVDPRHCLLVTDDVLPGHDRRRRSHGPRAPARDRGGHRPAGRDPDGDAERRRVLQPPPRSRLDRARPARRHPVRRGSPRLPPAPRARRRAGGGGAARVRVPARGVRVDPARAAARGSRPADRGGRRRRRPSARSASPRGASPPSTSSSSSRSWTARCRPRPTSTSPSSRASSGTAARARSGWASSRASACSAARSPPRSRTTTTTCSSPASATRTCSSRSSVWSRRAAGWSPSPTARCSASSSCRSPD